MKIHQPISNLVSNIFVEVGSKVDDKKITLHDGSKVEVKLSHKVEEKSIVECTVKLIATKGYPQWVFIHNRGIKHIYEIENFDWIRKI